MLCLKCKKVSTRRGIQLEDLNHALLRTVYFCNLVVFALVFFVLGLCLLPFGYCAFLFTKLAVVSADNS